MAKKKGKGKRSKRASGGGDHSHKRDAANNAPADKAKNELEFEDPFEDELMAEETNMVESKSMEMEDGDEDDTTGGDKKVWLPGMEIGADEKLEYDSTAYLMFHRLKVEWPCLSFDVIPDNGDSMRFAFPHGMYLAAGTQASTADENKLMILKLSDMHKTKYDGVDDSDAESDDGYDDDPIFEERSISHKGGVNRVRVAPQSPNMIATWAETGCVHIWDVASHLMSLDGHTDPLPSHVDPSFTFEGHPEEGFAMDWSSTVAGRLLTGDCRKYIYLFEPTESSFSVNKLPFLGHNSSVEDLQWSPNEENVFASCSSDKTVRIWDTRERSKSMIWVAAHKADVNVISWNKHTNHLLVSGSDDGSFKIWDLRMFNSASPAAHFKWHKGPITSVEWHPHDESIVGVASADNTISVWDMALEDDVDARPTGANVTDVEIPPQLLFIHQGQQDVKELHWHQQIPSCIVSTALDGFNMFIPSNMDMDERAKSKYQS